ncbi:MAG: N-acetylmuramoyl-L-alanine amidase [Candidatus Curtissbacteria bacterium GW2011_GWA1_40_16]|uniref:N-acetylmuramoyl-L-alanine amidase n=1 Tax=Candidatus Curtissbacteria bacterium GW2011_GWA1_40_16 TaxID=1618405 RepID=A0A0G0REU6_9BACT|nr:MAG: N-acetylmuramoyl-L-alanine amidase [Candidatus Curtissbacteria bacterium GW2011_GWA1_40_16]
MPALASITKHQSQVVKKILLIIYLLLLTILLSGCSTVSFNKPAALQVTSTPQASVFLDGKHLGKTPFYSDQITAGSHSIKISASQTSYVDKITLTSGTLTVINRELADNFMAQSGENLWLEPGLTGTLIISRPSDAYITIDGKSYGKTAKLVQDLEDGDHKVQLTADGFIPREFAIKTSSKYRLIADVTIASQIAKGQVAPNTPLTLPQTKKIEITKTPQGFLRVRKDASLTSDEIGRVSTGDQLEVIQETGEWVKVIFEGKQGWISKTYTKEIGN